MTNRLNDIIDDDDKFKEYVENKLESMTEGMTADMSNEALLKKKNSITEKIMRCIKNIIKDKPDFDLEACFEEFKKSQKGFSSDFGTGFDSQELKMEGDAAAQQMRKLEIDRKVKQLFPNADGFILFVGHKTDDSTGVMGMTNYGVHNAVPFIKTMDKMSRSMKEHVREVLGE